MSRSPLHALLYVGLAALPLIASPVVAQMPRTLEPDPTLPVREGFDLERAILWARPNFQPMYDPRWEPLDEALRDDRLEGTTPVVLFEAGEHTLTLVSSQLAYHHVAQGEMAGEPWMVTF